MISQTAPIGKCRLTLQTFVRFLSGMRPLMFCEISCLCKCRCAAALVFGLCALFLGYIITPQGFSSLTHLGGALFGILPAFLFQSHVSKHERVEAWLPVVAGVVLSLLYTICFSVLYAHTIHTVTCGGLL